jgi:hypothetical protein
MLAQDAGGVSDVVLTLSITAGGVLIATVVGLLVKRERDKRKNGKENDE